MVAYEPFKSAQDNLAFHGVFKASVDSGTDEPRKSSYKNTQVDTTFNTLNVSRYMLLRDTWALQDLAAYAPYDAIFVIVNSSRYGGGGIYNLYCTLTSDNNYAGYVFTHEFGHHFAGLADEYYTSNVSYDASAMYPPGVEPMEPNITRLMDPDNPKWPVDIKVPSSWNKNSTYEQTRGTQKVKAIYG